MKFLKSRSNIVCVSYQLSCQRGTALLQRDAARGLPPAAMWWRVQLRRRLLRSWSIGITRRTTVLETGLWGLIWGGGETGRKWCKGMCLCSLFWTSLVKHHSTLAAQRVPNILKYTAHLYITMYMLWILTNFILLIVSKCNYYLFEKSSPKGPSNLQIAFDSVIHHCTGIVRMFILDSLNLLRSIKC